MKIGITGSSGFIGSHLARLAREHGHEAIAFSRRPKASPDFVATRPFSTETLPDLSGLDAVVHLAGETIMGLWTPAKKRRILGSRIDGTRRVVEALNALPGDPPIFISGSATGYYGDTGDREVDETSPEGTGFLAEVASAWEREARNASRARTVLIRTGFVLGQNEGAMKMIAPVFRAGLGGNLGSGRQWMSCIHVADVAGLILHAIERPAIQGALNAVLPTPSRNSEFTRILASASHRPAIFPAPTIALKLILGELSHLLLDSQRVVPTAALATGYRFRFSTLESAAEDVIAKR